MKEINDTSKHQYLILEIGREKESYSTFFYHKDGVDLNTFISDTNKSLKSAAEFFIKLMQTQNGKEIDDFDLHFKAIQMLSEFGYILFEPHSISFTNMGFFGGEFDLDTSARHLIGEDELLFDFSSENDHNFFVYSSWNGLNESLVRNIFFRTNNNLETAYDWVRRSN